MTGEKKRDPQDGVGHERIFIRLSVEKLRSECKVIHHALPIRNCHALSCNVERRTQHSALIRPVTGLRKNWTATLVCSIRVCKKKHLVKDVSVLRHGDDFETLATRIQIAEFKEDLSKHLLVKHIATLRPRPQLFDVCEVRFLNRVIRWVVPPFGKAPERFEIEADPRH